MNLGETLTSHTELGSRHLAFEMWVRRPPNLPLILRKTTTSEGRPEPSRMDFSHANIPLSRLYRCGSLFQATAIERRSLYQANRLQGLTDRHNPSTFIGADGK
jgi:hypothetical protein